MKFTPKNIKKFQAGGEMPAQEPTTAPQGAPEATGGEQDPLMQVAQLAAQALQNQECNAAMQVCQIFLQMVQQMQGGQPEQPAGQPVFKKGGILVRRNKR